MELKLPLKITGKERHWIRDAAGRVIASCDTPEHAQELMRLANRPAPKEEPHD